MSFFGSSSDVDVSMRSLHTHRIITDKIVNNVVKHVLGESDDSRPLIYSLLIDATQIDTMESTKFRDLLGHFSVQYNAHESYAAHPLAGIRSTVGFGR